MTSVHVFEGIYPDNEHDPYWLPRENPPGISYETSICKMTLVTPPNQRSLVNGYPAICNFHVLSPGDLVWMVSGDGDAGTTYRIAGTSEKGLIPANGAICAFTGKTLMGDAFLCTNCNAWLDEQVVREMGQCVCGKNVSLEGAIFDSPGEELL